jgi:hypothetical protein
MNAGHSLHLLRHLCRVNSAEESQKKFKTQVKVGFLNKKSKLPLSLLISDLTFGRKDQTELY